MADDKVFVYSVRELRWRGKRDGRGYLWRFWPFFKKTVNIDPPDDQSEPALFEKELLGNIAGKVDEIGKKWSEMDITLERRCSQAEFSFREALRDDLKDLGDHRVTTARDALNAFDLPHLGPVAYWLIFGLITVGEIFFNYMIFSVAGQSKMETLIVALGLMVAMPVLSHVPGRYLAQKDKGVIPKWVSIIGVSAVLFGITAISLMRQSFFEISGTAEIMGKSFDTGRLMFSFFVFNIVMYTALLIVAYESGHKDPSGYKKATIELAQAEKELEEARRSGAKADAAIKKARQEWSAAHTERENTFEKIQFEVRQEINGWANCVNIYRAANMAARENKTRPVSFNTGPDTAGMFPVYLQKLDCDQCNYDSLIRKDLLDEPEENPT